MKIRIIVVLSLSVLLLVMLGGCKEGTTISTLPSEDILGTWTSTNAITNEMGTVLAGAYFEISRTSVTANYTWGVDGEAEPGAAFWTGTVSPDPATSITSVITITDDPEPTGTAPEAGDTLSLTYIMSGTDSAVLILGSDRADCIRADVD